MKYMCDVGLFENNNNVITCLKIAKRMDSSMTSNPKMRKLIQKIHENHDGVMTLSGLSHDLVMQEEKEEKEKKKPKAPAFKRPSLEEIKDYIKEKNYLVNPNGFLSHYESNGWKVGKNPKKCWKSAITSWDTRERKDNHKSEQPYGHNAI